MSEIKYTFDPAKEGTDVTVLQVYDQPNGGWRCGTALELELVKDRDALRAELAKSRGLLVTAISIIRNNVNYTKSPAWDSVRMAIKDIDEHLMKKGEP